MHSGNTNSSSICSLLLATILAVSVGCAGTDDEGALIAGSAKVEMSLHIYSSDAKVLPLKLVLQTEVL